VYLSSDFCCKFDILYHCRPLLIIPNTIKQEENVMTDKRNIFGHSTVAKPTGMPSNERLAQINEMLREDPEADLAPVEQNNMASGDLEQLIFLGRIEDSKVINGFQFDMQTLTGKEQNDVWLSVSFLNNDTKFFLIKVAFLARAIKTINGKSLEILYRGKDWRELSKEQKCVKVIETWQQPLIDELYDFYSELVDRSRKAINPEEVKK
jgi:hypothetical protein